MRARAREQALNKPCLINKHLPHPLQGASMDCLIWVGGMVPEIGLRSVRGADFAREGKSTAKPEKQSARGTRKNLVEISRARGAGL